MLVPEENATDAIYGLILVGALMAAESYRHESHLDVLASVLITVSVYWLAHAYSSALGEHLESGRALTFGSLRDGLTHGWAVVRGATIPVLALIVGWAADVASRTTLAAAVWSTVGALIAIELLAGIRAKAAPLELLLDCLLGAGIGVSVLALRALLH